MKRSLSIVLFVAFIVVIIYIATELLTPLPIGEKTIEVKIPRGVTFRQVIGILSKEGLIRNKTLFLIIGKMCGLERKIKAGYYSIYGSMSPLELLKKLRSGQIIEYEVVIIEGDSLREIGEKLEEKGIIKKEDFLRLSVNKDFLASYNIKAPSFEGYLFPDTYRIPKGSDPKEVVGVMINRMREKYSDDLRERAEEVGLSEREVLTLASIIEKEAKVDKERSLISAVYHNRLKKHLPLQADPTCIYGIKRFGEEITERDLRRKTPYNTYIIKGLPPGPIASPGIKSIMAALYPANVPYMFFVSNNDGTHRFSVTPGEHQVAVEIYRKKKNEENRGKDNGSS
ncbi:MAG: endolytic transglycosylase MltG [Nitrospirae bacterium]|nr:endolytic transglycosylase MltG [Nitrospirota bacterium]